MKAWWTYWLTLAIGVLAWIGVLVVLGRDGFTAALGQPLTAMVLISPVLLAGLNLVVFRSSHEAVCRLEVERHPQLSRLVGRGYSARTFALTGVSLLFFAGVFIVTALNGSR